MGEKGRGDDMGDTVEGTPGRKERGIQMRKRERR